MNRNQLLESAKPILFNTEMVQAIQDCRKTATRRVVKSKHILDYPLHRKDMLMEWKMVEYDTRKCVGLAKPHYNVGDILYVRETWSTQYNGIDDDNGYGEYVYKADGKTLDNAEGMGFSKWYPSIHMPKQAARIFLRVTGIRVERLQDIWASDVSKEGILFTKPHSVDEMIDKFTDLWNSTIKNQDLDTYGWNANPWVWVYEFERASVDE